MTTTVQPPVPAWAEPGAPVTYVSQYRPGDNGGRIHATTVARHTATLVVLANGAKFRRRDVTSDGCYEAHEYRGTFSSSVSCFGPVTNPVIVKRMHTLRTRIRRTAVDRAALAFGKDPSADNATILADAATNYANLVLV